MRVHVLALSMLLLLTAGCGGGVADRSSPTDDGSTRPEAEGNSVDGTEGTVGEEAAELGDADPPPVGDRDLSAVVVQWSEAPAGYVENRSEPDPESSRGVNEISSQAFCDGFSVSRVDPVEQASSVFAGKLSGVGSTAMRLASEQEASAMLAEWEAAFAECGEWIAESDGFEAPATLELMEFPDLGDQTTAGVFTTESILGQYRMEFALTRVDQYVVLLYVGGIDPMEPGLTEDLQRAMADRLISGEALDPPELEALDARHSKYLQGNFSPDLPFGEPDQLSVLLAEEVPFEDTRSLVAVVVRNNSPTTMYQLEVSGTASVDGNEVATFSSGSLVPPVVEPGEIAFGMVYFDQLLPSGARLDFAADGEASPDEWDRKVPLVLGEMRVVEHSMGTELQGDVSTESETVYADPDGVALCFDSNGGVTTIRSLFSMDEDVTESLAPGASMPMIALLDSPDSCPNFLAGAYGSPY